MEIKGFTFWRSWHEQCELLDDADRLAYVDAIRRYAFDGTVPSKDSVSPIVYAMFLGVIPNIDSNITNVLNGAKGGAPKGNQNARKHPKNNPNNPPCFEETTPLVFSKQPPYSRGKTSKKNLNLEFKKELELEKEEEEGEGEVSPLPPSKNSRFVPPSESEVAAWLKNEKQLSEREAGRIAMCFVSFYESKGWMVGKNKMKSWKAAIAGWLARDRQDTARAQEQAQGMNAGFDLEQYRYRPPITTGQEGGGTVESLQTHENARGLIEMPLAMIQH